MNRTFDLVERSIDFAKNTILLCRSIPKSIENQDLIRQLIRASSSVGANYVEANDALGKRDFLMKIKIARREANEAKYWLCILTAGEEIEKIRSELIDEADQLARILSAIAAKVEKR